jgi:hypothetical protein
LLDIGISSYKAGNTGVRNEIVSICDELLRQGNINKDDYKKIINIIQNNANYHKEKIQGRR